VKHKVDADRTAVRIIVDIDNLMSRRQIIKDSSQEGASRNVLLV